MLANYLPDASDPRYTEYERNLPVYKAELEKRYPQICVSCTPRANLRLKATAYAARSDHMRRQLLKSKIDGCMLTTGRVWGWRDVILLVAAIMWWAGFALQISWDLFGVLGLAESMHSLDSSRVLNQATCTSLGLLLREVRPHCFDAMTETAELGIAIGVLSIWYHPQLKAYLHSRGAKLNGYLEYIILQALTLSIRAFTLRLVALSENRYSHHNLRSLHAFMIAFSSLSTAVAIKTVGLNKPPLFSFMQPVPEIEVANTAARPNSNESWSDSRPVSDIALFTKELPPPFPIYKFAGASRAQPQDHLSLDDLRHQLSSDDNDTGYGSGCDDVWEDDRRSMTTNKTHQTMDWEPTTTHTFLNPQPTFAARMNLAMGNYPDSPFARAANPLLDDNGATPFRATLPAAPESPAARLRKPWQPVQKKVDDNSQRNVFPKFRGVLDDAAPHGTTEKSLSSTLRVTHDGRDLIFRDAGFAIARSESATGLEDMFGAAIKLDDSPSAGRMINPMQEHDAKSTESGLAPKAGPFLSSPRAVLNWQSVLGLPLAFLVVMIALGAWDRAVAETRALLEPEAL